MIISLKEARKILGKETSDKLSDEEIEKLIDDLDVLARAALKWQGRICLKPKKKKSKTEILEDKRKADALALAQLIYDIYKERKRSSVE